MTTRVRAVIENDHSVLLIHRLKKGKEYWTFPGGGIEEDDATEEDAVVRECEEELGVTVAVISFFAEVEPVDEQTHHELFFRCSITGGVVGTGTGPEFSRNPAESGTYEPQWVPISELRDKTVYPTAIKEKLMRG